MTTKRFIHTRPDGVVSVTCPALQFIVEVSARRTHPVVWKEYLAGMRVGNDPFDAATTDRLEGLASTTMTDEQIAFEIIRAKDIPATHADIREVDLADIPQSRRFRNAWRRSNGGFPTVDMPLARQQRRQEVEGQLKRSLNPAEIALLDAVVTPETLSEWTPA